MTEEKFLEIFNGAPLTFEEVAQEASNVIDNNGLMCAATKYLAAMEDIYCELNSIDYEFG
jgi:hypothetical protein